MPSLRSVADTSGTNVKVPAFATNTHEILSSSAFKTSSISSPAALFNMRFTYVLAAAAALAGSGLVQGLSLNPKTLPVSKHLYSFSLEFAENRNVSGPLGKRVGLGLTGGNMTAPNGTLIGKVVPGVGGETGIIDNNNNLEIDVKAFFQFLDDKKYAYAAIAGIGPLTGKPIDAHHIETDSPSRLAWNSYFIVANVSLVTPALLVGDAFAFATS